MFEIVGNRMSFRDCMSKVWGFRRLTVWNLQGVADLVTCPLISNPKLRQVELLRFWYFTVDTSNFWLLTSLTSISDDFLDFRCEPGFSIPEGPNVRTSKVPNLESAEPPNLQRSVCRKSELSTVNLSTCDSSTCQATSYVVDKRSAQASRWPFMIRQGALVIIWRLVSNESPVRDIAWPPNYRVSVLS